MRLRHKDLLDRVPMRFWIAEIRGVLCLQNRVRQKVRVVLRPNRHHEEASRLSDKRKRERRVDRVESGGEGTNVNVLVPVRVDLDAVARVSELFEQRDQSLLVEGPTEDAHVHTIDPLMEQVRAISPVQTRTPERRPRSRRLKVESETTRARQRQDQSSEA